MDTSNFYLGLVGANGPGMQSKKGHLCELFTRDRKPAYCKYLIAAAVFLFCFYFLIFVVLS